MANDALCKEQKVHAFPTLRLFRYEAALPPDYQTVGHIAKLATSFLLLNMYHRSYPPFHFYTAMYELIVGIMCRGGVQDRTVAALSSYVTRKLNVEEKRKNWPERDKDYQEHPGCMVRLDPVICQVTSFSRGRMFEKAAAGG